MLYLFIQTWGWILAAFILGLLIGWWLCCRCKCNKAQPVNSVAAKTTTSAAVAATATATATTFDRAPVVEAPASADAFEVDDASKPMGFTSAPADIDELKRIKGIGPVIERTLNDLGIYQFKQIAEFTSENVSWVESYLSFPGRIGREEWVSQAEKLSAGEETEFSKRVDKGDMNY